MVASLEPVIGRSEMSDRPVRLLSYLSFRSLIAKKGWTDDALSTMDKRLQSVADALVEKKPEPDDDAETMNVDSPPADLSISLPEYEQLPPGWTMLSVEKGWQPAPMGVFVRCS
jgi:ribosomal biogenesis protein LAS1